MKMTQREEGEWSIFELSGRLMGGADTEPFLKAVRELAARGRTQVLVDMGQVAWVNSSGLGALIAAWTLLKEKGGLLRLFRVSRRISQILAVTKLNTVFDVRDDEVSARAGRSG